MRVQVCPPSSLSSTAPLAGTTALTVVEVVPAARHEVKVMQIALCNRPVPAGTSAAVHVAPLSMLSTIAPCPCPVVVAVNPFTRQSVPPRHERPPASCRPAGRSPSRSQVRPKSVERADQNVVPSLAMTVQSVALGHATLETTMAPAGGGTSSHVAPASCVVSTTPADAESFKPTVMHRLSLGHEIPSSAGVDGSASGSPAQDRPPSVVASITSARVAGTEVEVPVPAAAVGAGPDPGLPTAQQCSASAQETASS